MSDTNGYLSPNQLRALLLLTLIGGIALTYAVEASGCMA